MKLLSTLLLFLCLTLHGAHVQWYGSFQAAHTAALQSNKTLMVLLLEHADADAKTLLSTLFMNRPYIKEIQTHFIAVLIRKNQRQSYPIEMLYTHTYPALFFLDAQELFTCKPLRGIFTAKQLQQHLAACR